MLTSITAIVTAAMISAPAFSQTDPSKLMEVTLDNGLDVMLRQVDGGNMITVMTLFDIGEKHEPQGKSGISHMVEHLYITCETDSTEQTTASEWFAKYSNQANAQTGEDYTVISASVEISQLPAELKRHAARMRSLNITEEDLARERPRVLEELANMYSRNAALAARNIARSYVDPLPTGLRRGGLEKDINNLTVEDLKQWYSDYYRPMNATLLVVGDFDPSEAAEVIAAEFLDIDSGKPLPEVRPIETKKLNQTVNQTIPGLRDKGKIGMAVLAFKAPEPSDPDYGPFLLTVPRIYQRAIQDGQHWSAETPPVTFAVLDDPGGLYVMRPIYEGEDPEHALQSLMTYVEWARTYDLNMPVDRYPFQYELATQLAVVRMPDTAVKFNTYGEALRLGRFKQLGMNSDAIRKKVTNTTPKSMNASCERLFNPENGMAVTVIWHHDQK